MLALLQSEGGDWKAEGHSVGTQWLELLGYFGVVALATAMLVFLVLAFVRRHRYRALEVLSETDLERLHAELAAAEKRTVGEILPVVVERSDAHPGACWVSATLTALVGSALLAAWLPWDRHALLLVCQVVLGVAGYGLARALPDFQRRFVRESRASEVAEEQALQEFFGNGLHETEERTGVLLFVSLFERRVIVLADHGIDSHVEARHWEETDRAVLAGIRSGSLCDGLAAGIRSAGDVLEKEFPWREGDRNEIPDRIIVRRE